MVIFKEKDSSNFGLRLKARSAFFSFFLCTILPVLFIYSDYTKYSALGHLNLPLKTVCVAVYILISFLILIKRRWNYLFFIFLSFAMLAIYQYSGWDNLIIEKGFYTLRGKFYKNLSHCTAQHYGKNQEQILAYCFRTYPEIEGGNYDIFYDSGGEAMLPENSRSCSWYTAWYSIARKKNDSMLYGISKEISMPSILMKISSIGHSFYAVEYDLFDRDFNYYPVSYCGIK
ncbi:hypothetical protein [Pantoea stewartii]|uniref:hypothetical protein n=1 Tax=Pantoea stewartii TaxID=66269 RepID=UPI000B315ACD|nr:hypothetical protein [Pantoea stewartii]